MTNFRQTYDELMTNLVET